MPIKGLTDRGVAFPQIGNIRKGAKKTDPKRPGAELPYFRVEFDEREVQAIQNFTALYPDGKPTDIVIILPFDDIDRVWHAWREAYTAGALQHRCDGEYVNYAINPQTGEVVIKDYHNAAGEMVKCERKDFANKAQRCKPTGRLHIIIPQLERLAYLVVHTTSIWDIARISEQLAAIREMNGGHIAGIPLVLRRRPVEISTPSGENGTRARRIKHMISIEADPEWVAAKLAAMRSAALPKPVQLPQLTAPISGPEWTDVGDEDDEEEEVVIDGSPEAESTERPKPEPEARTEKPERKPYQKAYVKFNGLTATEWHARADAFAAKNTNWQSGGAANLNHILVSAGHAGYEVINGYNIDEVFAAIVATHEAKAQP